MLAGTKEFWERLKAIGKEDYNFFLAKASDLVKDATAKGVATFLDNIKKERTKEGDKEDPLPRFVRIAAQTLDQVKEEALPKFLELKNLKIDASNCLTCWRSYLSQIALSLGGYLRQWVKDLAEKAKQFLQRVVQKVDEFAGKALSLISQGEGALTGARIKKSNKKAKPLTPEQVANGEQQEQAFVDVDLLGDDKDFADFEKDLADFEKIKAQLEYKHSPTHSAIFEPVLNNLNGAVEEIRAKKVLQIAE